MNRRSFFSGSLLGAIGSLFWKTKTASQDSQPVHIMRGSLFVVHNEEAIRKYVGYIEQTLREEVAKGSHCTHEAWSAWRPVMQDGAITDHRSIGGGYSIMVCRNPSDLPAISDAMEQGAAD